MIRKIVALFLVASLPAAAQADVVCDFKIAGLWVTPDGAVNVALSTPTFGRGWWFCNVSANTTVNDGYATKTVTDKTCTAYYSLMMTLKTTNQPISLQFHGPADCSSAALPGDGIQPNPWPANIGVH